MEKLNNIIIVLLLSSIVLSAQDFQNTTNYKKSRIVYTELNLEGGVDISLLKNDSIIQKYASSPYLLLQYENYYSDKLRLNLMLAPVAIHTTKDEKQLFKERYFQPEFGITGSYMLFNNLWITAGGGYAYRFYKQYRVGANAWTKTDFKQPGAFIYGSVDYWIKSSVGLRVASMYCQDGHSIRIGMFANFNSIKNIIKHKSRNRNMLNY